MAITSASDDGPAHCAPPLLPDSVSQVTQPPLVRDAEARLRIRVTAASLRGQKPTVYLSLYFLTQFLKLYAIPFDLDIWVRQRRRALPFWSSGANVRLECALDSGQFQAAVLT